MGILIRVLETMYGINLRSFYGQYLYPSGGTHVASTSGDCLNIPFLLLAANGWGGRSLRSVPVRGYTCRVK